MIDIDNLINSKEPFIKLINSFSFLISNSFNNFNQSSVYLASFNAIESLFVKSLFEAASWDSATFEPIEVPLFKSCFKYH